MKIGLIIQARMQSSRLPGKVLKKVYGRFTVLDILILRLKKVKHKGLKLIVATSKNAVDDAIEDLSYKHGIACYRGDESNVLKRFQQIVKKEKFDYVVRITADCPLVDPSHIKQMINDIKDDPVDYASNTLVETYPDGFDIELLRSDLLFTHSDIDNRLDSEHVTFSIRSDQNNV